MFKFLILFGVIYLIYRVWEKPTMVINGEKDKEKNNIIDPDEYVDYEEVE